jgi:hypothetical protein
MAQGEWRIWRRNLGSGWQGVEAQGVEAKKKKKTKALIR